ncbi:MAG: glycosyltransferase family 2 protein, partial [Candidatus Sericytochromatia bacterium]
MPLTIVIPTYNRHAILRENLPQLLRQMTPDCQLLILDDCSPTPVANELADVLAAHPEASVEVVRHHTNLGMSGNLTRCFERCETEWMWLLSDDDAVQPDAIKTIYRRIAAHPECIYFNFSSALARRETAHVTRGLAEFVECMDYFGNVLFMSVGVYRTPAVRRQVRFGCHYGYSFAPHVAILLAAIGPAETCCYAPEEVVTWNPVREWPLVPFSLGIMTLLELPMDVRAFQALRHRIATDMRLLDMSYLAAQCRHVANSQDNPPLAQHLFDQAYHRLIASEGRLSDRLLYAVHRKLLVFPRLGERLVAASRWLR